MYNERLCGDHSRVTVEPNIIFFYPFPFIFSPETTIKEKREKTKKEKWKEQKDILAVSAYEFELLHNRSFLVKSFAYAHGEIIHFVNCEIFY